MTTLLLNTAINVVVTYNTQENTLQVAHHAGESTRWKQRLACLLTFLKIATVHCVLLAGSPESAVIWTFGNVGQYELSDPGR